MNKNAILKTEIDFSEEMVAVLEDLQRSKNDAILMYVEHLDRISNLIFRMGDNMEAAESKNELFEMLHANHMLRKDLEGLKASG